MLKLVKNEDKENLQAQRAVASMLQAMIQSSLIVFDASKDILILWVDALQILYTTITEPK